MTINGQNLDSKKTNKIGILMGRKPKNKYKIEKIQEEYNKMSVSGKEPPSLRKVYRKLGYPEVLAQAWVKRNFYTFIKFEEKIKNP